MNTEENYPTQEAMQSYASALGLTSKQVRGWFIERRRRDKRDNETDRSKTKTLSSRYECTSTRKESSINKRAEKIILQDLLTPGYILKKLFRKDGPPLGVQFDSLPSKVFHQNMGVLLNTSTSVALLDFLSGMKIAFSIFSVVIITMSLLVLPNKIKIL